MIAIIDYGAGNIGSVKKAFDYLQIPYRRLEKPENLDLFAGVVLPGVGAFGAAVAQLRQSGFTSVLKDCLRQDKPFLGICLGMQILLESSEESPNAEGLGFFHGSNRRFRVGKVPQVGWNRVRTVPGSRLFDCIPAESYFYFVHGYYASADTSGCTGISDYHIPFAVALEMGNICGVQFHPEKSGASGLKLLSNWATLCAKESIK